MPKNLGIFSKITLSKKLAVIFLIFQIIFCIIFIANKSANAGQLANPSYNDDVGTYSDNFSNNSGIPTRSYVNANTSIGKMQLTSQSSQTTFTTPYRTEGYAITEAIQPLLMAKWGNITFTRNVPEGTTLKVQVLDMCKVIYSDEYLSGNSSGLESSTIDISNIPVLHNATANEVTDCNTSNKPPSITIKFIMTTSDTSVTPTVSNLVVNWIKNQGDVSASSISTSDPWPTITGDQQGTLHSDYNNPKVYPVFKWASPKNLDPFAGKVYALNDKIIGSSDNLKGYLFANDRETGEEIWKIPAQYFNWAYGSISENGTYYGNNIFNDTLSAIDTDTGQVKWIYTFLGGGHSNYNTVLGSDGTIFLIRFDVTGTTVNVMAFNPDGSLKWEQSHMISETEVYIATSPLSIASDGALYFGTSGLDVNTYENTGFGELFAINPTDGSLKWKYNTGSLANISPVIDSNGHIYVTTKPFNPSYTYHDDGSYDTNCNLAGQKIFSINPDGSLKWQKTLEADNGCYGYQGLSLRSDGVLIGIRDVSVDGSSDPKKMEAIRISDGELLWTRNFVSSNGTISFTDGNNGILYSENFFEEENSSIKLNYLDASNNLKWKINYPYNGKDGDNFVMHSFESMVPDERGWIYGGFEKGYFAHMWYDAFPENSFAQNFALAPWDLIDSSNLIVPKVGGNVLNFTVTTSMLQANALLGGDNQMQVIMDNGDKVSLAYNSTNDDGNSIWTGSYTLPISMAAGEHTYTIEASQPYLQTDIATHFDVAPVESNNTGITTTGTFQISDGIVIEDPNSEKMQEEFASGRISIQGENPMATDNFTFNKNYTFVNKEASVFIPSGTVVVGSNGEKIDLTKFITEDNFDLIKSDLDNAEGSIKFGISGFSLSFSQTISVTIPVGQENNGRTLKIKFQREGEEKWREEDVACLVSGGECIFQTDHATTFVAGKESPKAKITSWKAYQYTDLESNLCQNKLKVEIKGKHFDDDAQVSIGNKKAFDVDVKSNKRITASFCYDKLLKTKTSLTKTLKVTNPNAETAKAKKEINLKEITPKFTLDDFNTQTTQGIKNVQTVLAKEEFLEEKDVNGIYDLKTKNAIKEFQKKNGIPQTGVVGPLTRAELEKI